MYSEREEYTGKVRDKLRARGFRTAKDCCAPRPDVDHFLNQFVPAIALSTITSNSLDGEREFASLFAADSVWRYGSRSEYRGRIGQGEIPLAAGAQKHHYFFRSLDALFEFRFRFFIYN